MFFRTILELDDDATCKKILRSCSLEFAQDRNKSKLNKFDSPIFLLNTFVDVGLYESCMNMIHRDHVFSKTQWKKLVWDAVWSKEDGDCHTLYRSMSEIPILFNIIGKSYYLIWWILSDNIPNMMGICEKMAALVCNSSLLKAHDVRLKRESFWTKTCSRCELSLLEDTRHIGMQCPFYENKIKEMYDEISKIECDEINEAFAFPQNMFHMILGKQPDNVSTFNMLRLCSITGKHIAGIYNCVLAR